MPKIIDDMTVYRAVIEVFIRNGYHNATTLQIAKAAGINEATLFRKYKSKAALLCEALAVLLGDTPVTRLRHSGDLRTDLRAIVNAYIETSAIYGPIFPAVLSEVPRHPELRASLDVPIKGMTGVGEILMKYQETGELKPESPIIAATNLLAPLMVRQSFGRAMGAVIETDVETYIESFLHGKALG